MSRKKAKGRKMGAPDEPQSSVPSSSRTDALWDWELHCLLSRREVRSCFVVHWYTDKWHLDYSVASTKAGVKQTNP